MLYNILAWIIVGGVAGWLASLLVRGAGLGVIGDIIVGIVGALIGGFLIGLLVPGVGFSGFNLVSLLVAFVGAVVLLFIIKLFTRGRTATTRY